MFTRGLALIRKEFLHVFRDPRTLVVMFLVPIIELVLPGYSATTDIGHLRTAALDSDKSAASRALIEAYWASNLFDIAFYVGSQHQLECLADGGQARPGLIIPAGYGRELAAGGQVQIAFVIGGSDPSVAKVTPYVFISFFDVLEVLAIGMLWFGVPIRGNLGLLLGLSALFLITSLGIGIPISSVANTQQEALLLTFRTMLPSILLGEFFFPLKRCPADCRSLPT
jgi:hypothetical protein